MSKQTIYVVHKADITKRLFSVFKRYATKTDKLSNYWRGYAQALEWVLDLEISTIIVSKKAEKTSELEEELPFQPQPIPNTEDEITKSET